MMAPCHEIEILLTEFAAGELLPAEQAQVTRHLVGCRPCREEAARETQLRSMLGALPSVPCPERLTAAIRQQTVDVAVPVPGPLAWLSPSVRMGLVAAALMIAILAPGLFRPSPDGQVAPATESAWSQQDIAAARKDMLYTLGLTAEVLNRSSRNSMADVFGDRIPQAINGSLKLKPLNPGGKG